MFVAMPRTVDLLVGGVTGMAKPQHRTKEYRQAYAALRRAQARGEWLICVEPDCRMTSRDIPPDCPASVSHDESGTVIIGPSHLHCNLHEAAVRGNRMRRHGADSWRL